MKTTSKVTQTLISAGLEFGGYMKQGTPAVFCAHLAAKEIFRLEGKVAGAMRSSESYSNLHARIRACSETEWKTEYLAAALTGYDQGIRETLTKSGVKAALVSMGYTEFPALLRDAIASPSFISEEKDYADYLALDTDCGGAWNDDAQVAWLK